MKAYALLSLFILPLTCIGQVQLGGDIDGEAAGDWSGQRIALSADGTVVAIGASRNDGNGENAGHVRVFHFDGATWIQVGDDIDGEAPGDNSGFSVSLASDGSLLAVGAVSNDGNGSNSGHVRVYQNIGDSWIQVGEDIDGESAGESSGFSVSLSADGLKLAIGARWNNDNGSSSGQVRVYQYDDDNWTQVGDDINGESAFDMSGFSVSLSDDGSVLAIGAPLNDGIVFGSNCGHVRVYEYLADSWTQIGDDINGDAVFNNQSGSSVSLSADGIFLAIGAPLNSLGAEATGNVKIYQNDGGSWIQVGETISAESSEDGFGEAVSLSADGTIVAIGGPFNSGNGNAAGHTRVYRNENGTWTQVGSDIDGEFVEDLSGQDVALSADGKVIAIGARRHDGNGDDSGHVKVYHLASSLSNEQVLKPGFKVYPNPSETFLTVQLDKGLNLERIDIFNALGQLVKTERNSVISVVDLENGTYYLRIATDQGAAGKAIIVQ